MNFSVLQARMIQTLHRRVRNGEITIRGLALVIGVSQPHLQNLIAGRRALTAEVADRILAGLGLTIRELLDDKDAEVPEPRQSHCSN